VLGFPETIGAYAYVVPRDGRALIGSAFNSAEPIDRARPTRWAPGRFRVDFPRLAPLYSKSTVLVTAEGGVNCKVAGWMKLTDDVAVFVDCYGLSGELQDSSFYVTLVTDARF
jgi:hypothetical protein